MLTATIEDTRQTRLKVIMSFLMEGRPELGPNNVYSAPTEDRFQHEEEALDFLPAPDLATIAAGLLAECAEFSHLQELSIIYLWKKKGGLSQGKVVLGKCVKTGGLVSYFSEAPWVIWLAADGVNDYAMTRRQVEALLYHELNHAGEKTDEEGNATPSVEAHDVEAFSLEIQRYGKWTDGLRQAKEAFEQPPLFDTKTLGV